MNSFERFELREELKDAIAEMGYTEPTPIQEKVIPVLLNEPKDIIALAQTGTGKTAAFGLPLLNHIDTSSKHIQALVLSPTRELCIQIKDEFKKFTANLRQIKVSAVYGGVPISGQLRDLKFAPQVLVATPGRLIDLIDRGAVNLDNTRIVVLDEADEMLNMGFRDDINTILKQAEAREFTWLFSATMNNDVRMIVKKFMKQFDEFKVAKENMTNENIEHKYFVTNNHQRFDTVKRLLDFTPSIYGIIFTRTKQDCNDISELLLKDGYDVAALHGDLDQKMRSKVLDRFRRRELQIVVATDVAARGIDINDITHVINYELPDDPEVYTHRSGRTARAGKKGICMSVVTPKELSKIRAIERLVNSRFIKSEIPQGGEVIKQHLEEFAIDLANTSINEDAFENWLGEYYMDMQELDNQELIKKLLWSKFKTVIEKYENCADLNAGFSKGNPGQAQAAPDGKKWLRMYINVGTKDGMNEDKLKRYIADVTEVDTNLIDRFTVREMSSFFNVKFEAVEYIKQILTSKKYNGRKLRIEEATPKPGDARESRHGHSKSGGDFKKKKFQKAYR